MPHIEPSNKVLVDFYPIEAYGNKGWERRKKIFGSFDAQLNNEGKVKNAVIAPKKNKDKLNFGSWPDV